MRVIFEGSAEDGRMLVERVSGSGSWSLTSPQRRILTSTRTLVAGYDWAACTWDSVASDLYTLFDSALTGLTAPGDYYLQFRCTIGAERPEAEMIFRVKEWGP
jgi:hypothetical protein